MGRYTLNVNINGKGRYSIEVPENGTMKEKVDLSSVDAFTIGESPTYILKALGFESAKVIGKATFYISYIVKGKEKRLDAIFTDTNNLSQVARNNSTKISINNLVFNDFIEKVFIPLTKDYKFMQFLRDNNFLSSKLDEYISYLYGKRYAEDFCISKIKEYASSYKQFRELVIAVELYKNPKFFEINEEQLEESSNLSNQDELDSDKYFGLYSPEEIEKYQEYMDSLPDSFDVHAK